MRTVGLRGVSSAAEHNFGDVQRQLPSSLPCRKDGRFDMYGGDDFVLKLKGIKACAL